MIAMMRRERMSRHVMTPELVIVRWTMMTRDERTAYRQRVAVHRHVMVMSTLITTRLGLGRMTTRTVVVDPWRSTVLHLTMDTMLMRIFRPVRG